MSQEAISGPGRAGDRGLSLLVTMRIGSPFFALAGILRVNVAISVEGTVHHVKVAKTTLA